MVQPSRREILVAGSAFAATPALLACGGQAAAMSATTQSDGREATLRELLAFNRTKHPRYRGGLANHLPMALCSQYSLGASSERLKEFANRYSAMLDPLPVGAGQSIRRSGRDRSAIKTR